MPPSPGTRISPGEQLVTWLLTPLVLGWDFAVHLLFRFFAFMERLDIFAAAAWLLRKAAPPVVRLWRRLVPYVMAWWETATRIGRRLIESFRPLIAPLARMADAIWKPLGRLATAFFALIGRAARRLRLVAEPALRTVRSVVALVRAPFRRVSIAIRASVRRVRVRLEPSRLSEP